MSSTTAAKAPATGQSAEPDTSSFSSQRHWVTLPNDKHYRAVSIGDPAKPILLLLHGYTDSWRSFEPLIPLLRDDYHLIAFDQRGHGDTAHQFDSYTLEDFAVDAIAFTERFTDRPVALVGHSLGTLIAQRVAAARPNLVARLVLIGAAASATGNPALNELRQAVDNLTDPIPEAFAHEFQSGTVHRPIDPRQLAIFVAESRRVRAIVWQDVLRSLATDTKIVAADIAAPTLLLWGDRDAIFDEAQQQRLEAQLRQGTRITYRDTGHAPHWERPLDVAADIRRFVS